MYDCKGSRAACHALVPDIQSLQPDLIYIWGTPAAEEIAGHIDEPSHLKNTYIRDIPIISLCITDPVQTHLIKNTHKPGRNLTGVTHVAPIKTQLKTMITYLPKLNMIAALYNPLEPNGYYQIQQLKECASLHDIQVMELPIPLVQGVPDPNAIGKLIDKAHKYHTQFLYLPSDTFLSYHMDVIIEKSHALKLLTFASTESHYWKAKPLLGVFNRFLHVGQFGGKKAVSILQDKKNIKHIPFETLPQASVVISKSAFKAVDCPPPLSMLNFAHICD